MTILSEVSKSRYKDKACQMCNEMYTPTGACSKVCEKCRPEARRALARKGTQDYRIRHGLVEKPGVGKGGNSKKGVEDSSYKTGIAYFMKSRRRIREERQFCEECGKDLTDATHYQWVIHHKDHDRTNNVDSNFQLLCKRCHQIEHNCHLAFTKTCNDYPVKE